MSERAWPYGLSSGIGLGAAALIFGWPVLAGTAAFWDNPHGIVGSSAADMMASLSGYDVFVRDQWRWPLLRVEGLGGPGGTNIAYTDSLPLLALVGRGLYRLTGEAPVLYGLWIAACFMLLTGAMVALVRALGGRSLGAAVATALISVSLPPLLARWGHITLLAQGLIPLTVLAYLHVVRGMRVWAGLAMLMALCTAALLTFPYLFFMVVPIAFAALLQAAGTRQTGWGIAVLRSGALAAALLVALIVTGHLGGDGFADKGFGVFSMNVLSPVVPQVSGLFPAASGMLDATGGQYEGFAYLGGGLLLVVVLAAPELRRALPRRVRRHPWFTAVLVGSMLLAVSNEVYAGPYHLLSIPVPDALAGLFGIVRSSGRLAWIGVYVVAALAIATIARWRWGGLVLAVACVLQVVDAAPLRAMIGASVTANDSTIDGAAWRAALPQVTAVLVDPPFLCITEERNRSAARFAAAEIQLKASQSAVPVNSVYGARTRPDCRVPPGRPGTLYVGIGRASAPAPLRCATGVLLTVCHDTLPLATLAALAATTAIPGSGDGP